MNMKIGKDKYLILRMRKNNAGLDHILAIFKSAIKEAIYLGRTLVIDKYYMHRLHNLGSALENLDIERYINLDKTRIHRIKANGSIEQIKNAFRYIRVKDFDLGEYPAEQILELYTQPITEGQNDQYKVIVRDPKQSYSTARFYSDILVAFHPSDEVIRLTDVVLRTMGTSLADAKKRAAVYRDVDFSANRDIYQQDMLDNPLEYVCLHVRGNDTFRLPHCRYAAASSQIESIVRQIVPKGTRVYIMSDIRKPGHFSFLEKDYIVHQYYDFPELKALISDGSGQEIDNSMLYSVEKNIFQYATLKIVRSNKCPKIVYLNCVFRVPWRHRALALYEYLVRTKYKRTLEDYIEDIKRILINPDKR